MQNLIGKKALVTGAGAGIGREISLQLAAEGMDLYLLDVDESNLAETVETASLLSVKVVSRVCDLTDPQQISAAIQHVLSTWGGVDVLVNNAGVAFYGSTHSMTSAQWDWLLGINLHAPIQITRELLPSLLNRPEAHIVNVSSICGLVPGNRFSAYQVSKFGLQGFSEALRAEYSRQGVGVSSICPGPVTTRLFETAPSGRVDKQTPIPPRWICTTPELVAQKVIKAIYRDQGLCLVGWVAYVLYYLKRIAPWSLDLAFRWGRRKCMKKKAALLAQQAELQLETAAGDASSRAA